MNTPSSSLIHRNRIFAWIALATGGILLIPLIAMQFDNGVNWDATDFIVMGCLLFVTGSLFVLVARVVPPRWRIVTAIAFALGFLYLWAELAVGIFTNWGS